MVFTEVQAWLDSNLSDYQHGMQGMFWAYTRDMLEENKLHGIMDYEDFCRCVYSLGVVNIIDDDTLTPIYRQLPTWRPSLDRIRRLEVPQL